MTPALRIQANTTFREAVMCTVTADLFHNTAFPGDTRHLGIEISTAVVDSFPNMIDDVQREFALETAGTDTEMVDDGDVTDEQQ
jgi:hypothetical protein